MLSDKVVKKPSAIHGYGLFAKDDIKKGEILWTEDSNIKKITLEQFKNLTGKEKEEWDHYSYCVDGFVCIEYDDSRYWNHSFNANSKDEDITCIASRDIKKGEELTWDYSNCLVPNEELPAFMREKSKTDISGKFK